MRGAWDILTDLPFCVFVFAAAFPRGEEPGTVIAASPQQQPGGGGSHAAGAAGSGISGAERNGDPAALCAGYRDHFGSFVVYGMRSAVLQSRVVEAQKELEKARDRLEQLALLDGLTGVANRRCFDQR